ncbi:MAG: DUF6090 family protein [Bacteroidia bacterium]|nr:DUF6090 family protein [Bacteroidia bacterium]
MKINWKYALGEVAIVILGITLAFWLNNWGSNVSNRQLRNEYLQNLVLDLDSEAKQLETNTKQSLEKINLINQLRPVLLANLPLKDSSRQMIYAISRNVGYYPENTTYKTLVNSGDLKLINNFELRRSIEAYYSQQENTAKSYERLESIYKNYLGDFFIHNMDFGGLNRGELVVKDRPLLSNIFSSIQGSSGMAIGANKTLLEKNQQLKADINKFLGK